MIENDLVPKHEILTPEEAKAVLEKYNATLDQMPKILSSDAAIEELKPKIGDLVKITRKNPIIGKSYYYRVVIEG